MRALVIGLFGLFVVAACGNDGPIDVGVIGAGGKAEGFKAISNLPVPPQGAVNLTAQSAASFRVKVVQEGAAAQQLMLSVGGASISRSEPAPAIDHLVAVTGEGGTFEIELHNLGTEWTRVTVSFQLDTGGNTGETLPLPSLADPVVTHNEFATYSDKAPYIRDENINWTHPLIRDAMRALGPGWRSTISYWNDRRVAYKLETERPSPAGMASADWKARRTILEAAEKARYGWNGDNPTLQDIANQASTPSYPFPVEKILSVYPGSEADALARIWVELADYDRRRRDAKVRNLIRVLLGEYRDYPEMIRAKLQTITTAHHYASGDEVPAFDTSRNLFTQISEPAYQRMVSVMQAMHSWRQSKLHEACNADVACANTVGFNYNFGDNYHKTNRVSLSVAPWTHCEMKYMFQNYMVAGAPTLSTWGGGEQKPEDYEAGYAAYRGVVFDAATYDDKSRLQLGPGSQCSAEDMAAMYNFRGHVNYKALWLESNGFIHNSRRGNELRRNNDHSYYLRPFASRYLKARQLLGSYLFHSDEDNLKLREASESGGGPILYVTDEDSDGDNIADYRLFNAQGCGDTGVGSPDPATNCNMVWWDLAYNTPSVTGHLASWNPADFWSTDMGLLAALPSFEQRMARFNGALDRHTNWGPTGYYLIGADAPNPEVPQCSEQMYYRNKAAREEGRPEDIVKCENVRFLGTYSPIVACSYDISASSGFAGRDFETTHPWEQGKTKWMFIMRFRTADYYDERDMQAGKPFDFNRTYFNETSLSNDEYNERALDRFGWVPPADIHANIYFTYGARGETPVLEDIPAPQ